MAQLAHFLSIVIRFLKPVQIFDVNEQLVLFHFRVKIRGLISRYIIALNDYYKDIRYKVRSGDLTKFKARDNLIVLIRDKSLEMSCEDI